MNQSEVIDKIDKGNFETIFYILLFLSLLSIVLFSNEIYKYHKTHQLFSDDISKYEYLLMNDNDIPADENGIRDI